MRCVMDDVQDRIEVVTVGKAILQHVAVADKKRCDLIVRGVLPRVVAAVCGTVICEDPVDW